MIGYDQLCIVNDHLQQQIASLTKERDERTAAAEEYLLAACAAQAREAKLREALKSINFDAEPGDWLEEFETLALHHDDTALQQRLAQERERIAIHFDNKPDQHFKAIADAIRGMK